MNGNSKFNAFALIVLVLLNIVTVAALLLKQPEQHATEIIMPPGPDRPHGPPGHKGPGNFIVNELELNEEQRAQFDALKETHHTTMKGIHDQVKAKKEALFEAIGGDEATATAIAQEIGALQTQLEMATYQHFTALRNICTPEQQTKLDGLMKEIMRHMAPGPKGRPGGPPPPHPH